MKPLLFKIRSSRAPDAPPVSADDNLGRGMEIAILFLVFLGIGWAIDRWLGVFPVFTIGLVLFAAVGVFTKMKYTYDAAMEQHEAKRLAARTATPASQREDVA